VSAIRGGFDDLQKLSKSMMFWKKYLALSLWLSSAFICFPLFISSFFTIGTSVCLVSLFFWMKEFRSLSKFCDI
jgi:hypothetical protein